MSSIDVNDVLSIVRHVEHVKGKFVKQVLSQLEQQGKLDPLIRKIVLDGFNNEARAICRGFGYTIDE